MDHRNMGLTAREFGLPRLGPSVVRRRSLEDWLARFKNVPIRFLVAPPGFGKTVALLGYLRHCASNAVYCALPPGADADTIWSYVGHALGSKRECRSHVDVFRALAERAPLEIALDCKDVPSKDGLAAILLLMEQLPDEVALLIACRSRAAFQVRRFVDEGTAVLCDAERLAFDASEIRHVAETCGVPFTHVDVARLLDVTDGWPQVVSGAVRKASEDSCGLAQAFENWRARHGHLFNEFVAWTRTNVAEREADLLLKIVSGSHLEEWEDLQLLEEQGLFVIHTADGFRPLRALSQSRLYNRYSVTRAAKPMQVSLLGWFEATVDGRPIEWIRRRDRQVFKYLALQPKGRASRAQVTGVFWPDAPSDLAGKSLRTACSNIRKAIAKIVGFDQVDAYFRVRDEISLDLENVVVDAKRFAAHAADGDDQYARGQLRSAAAHYRNAVAVHRGDLLIADVREAWVAPHEAELKQRFAEVGRRLAEIGESNGYESAAA
ncbi:MAG TPA: BTAD domain-containing putative transcriptional regulator [Candidatus Cybelea sp.]|nr:BTAD domain-containing putative transcriptional regulator [Candidatus Cybelea sp.]